MDTLDNSTFYIVEADELVKIVETPRGHTSSVTSGESTVTDQTTLKWKEMPVSIVPVINGSCNEDGERSDQLDDLRGRALLCEGKELREFAHFVWSLSDSDGFTKAVEDRT